MIPKIGGIFALFVFWHFVSDWIFQSTREAMIKAKNFDARAKHCFVYTTIFVIPMTYIGLFRSWEDIAISSSFLFLTHFIIDSYLPTFLWAKYLRRDPSFYKTTWNGIEYVPITLYEAGKIMSKSPIGIILIIVVDQLLHITCLIPIAILAATNI